MTPILVDAGPLVALVSARDQHHIRCVHQLRSLQPPLLTTWVVVAEAVWLVRKDRKALRGLFQLGIQGLFDLAELDKSALPWLNDFLERYKRLKAQLADASLVYLAEREGIDTVFTLDRRDFSVYRFGRNQAFTLLPED